jgi:hypothetical protein
MNFKFIRKLFGKDVLLLLVLGLLPLTWFKSELIAGGDEYWLLDPSIFSKYFIYAWNEKLYNSGGPNFSMAQLFPIISFWLIFKSIGLSSFFIQRLWYIFLFLAPGLSMYYFMSTFYNKPLAKVIASVYYMFNLFVIYVDPLQPNVKPVLIAMPLMLAFWIRGLKSGKLTYAILIGLSSLIYAESNVNPPAVVCIYFALFFYFLFYLIFIRTNILRAISFVFITFLIGILLNMWWFLTFLNNVITSYGTSAPENWNIFGNRPIVDIFRLIGGWAWKASHLGSPYFPYANSYYEPFLIVATYLLVILLFLVILVKPKNHYSLFFSILAVVGMFLAKGTQEPFGNFYFFLFRNLPFFWIFREPFTKFTPLIVLSYSILLGMSADVAYEKLKTQKLIKYSNILADIYCVALILIILVVSFPLVIGDVYPKRSLEDPLSSLHVVVPDYWKQLGDWLSDNDPNARIFITPKTGYGATYLWTYRFSGDPPIILLPNPIIECKGLFSPYTLYSDSFVDKVYDYIDKNYSKIVKFLEFLNVQYVLQQNDFDYKLMSPYKYSPDYMRKFFQNQEALSLVKTFGKLDLYSINDSYLLPRIYATNQLIIVKDLSEMFNEVEAESFNLSKFFPVFIIQCNDCKLDHYKSNETYSPVILFEEVNPSKYVIYVRNATKPFFLVLSESYNPQWKVYTGEQKIEIYKVNSKLYSSVNVREVKCNQYTFALQDIAYLFSKPAINETYHFIANGYANSWYIDPKKYDKDGDGCFTITLYFWPQSLFYLGLIVSGLALAVCTGYLAYDWKYRRR